MSILTSQREELARADRSNPLLVENPNRWVLFPVQYTVIFQFYKLLEQSFWTSDSFAYKKDCLDYTRQAAGCLFFSSGSPSLAIDIRYKIEDELVYSCALSTMFQVPEARAFMGFQTMLESIHRRAMSKFTDGADDELLAKVIPPVLLDALLAKNTFIRAHLQGLVESELGDVMHLRVPAEVASFGEILITFAIKKCLFTTSLLLALYYEKQRNATGISVIYLTKTLTNLYLMLDFYCYIYRTYAKQVHAKTLVSMLVEAAEKELTFLNLLASNVDCISNEHLAKYAVIKVLMRLVDSLGHGMSDELAFQDERFADYLIFLKLNMFVEELPVPPVAQVNNFLNIGTTLVNVHGFSQNSDEWADESFYKQDEDF